MAALMSMLYDSMSVEEKIQFCVEQNCVDKLEIILMGNPGVTLNTLGTTRVGGQTLLHQAAIDGKSSVCELLMKHGFNPDAPNDFGYSPIILGITKDHATCTETFLRYLPWRYDVRAQCMRYRNVGRTDQARVLQVLIRACPDPNALGPRVMNIFLQPPDSTVAFPKPYRIMVLKLYIMTGGKLDHPSLSMALAHLVDREEEVERRRADGSRSNEEERSEEGSAKDVTSSGRTPFTGFREWTTARERNPVSLQELARVTLRHCIGGHNTEKGNVLAALPHLPLPPRVRDFVCFNEERDYLLNELTGAKHV